MAPEATLVALFLTGLLGGVHCAGMCGGIVAALGLLDAGVPQVGGTGAASRVAPLRFVASVPTGGAPPATGVAAVPGDCGRAWRRARRLLAYNVGRLGSYTALGTAAGMAGSFGWLLGTALPLQQLAFAGSSVLVIAMGLYVLGERRLAHRLEALGEGPWRRLRPVATAALTRAGSPGGALAAGALWGLVPCGMVYAALAAALLSGSATSGAALMLAFGVGTLPNLLLLGSGATAFGRLARRRPVRLGAGLLIIAFGVLGLLRLDIAREIPLLGELCARPPGVGA